MRVEFVALEVSIHPVLRCLWVISWDVLTDLYLDGRGAFAVTAVGRDATSQSED